MIGDAEGGKRATGHEHLFPGLHNLDELGWVGVQIHRVRYYGFLSPTAKVPLEDIKALVELAHGFTVTVPEIELPPWPQPTCQACGGAVALP